MAGAGEVAWAIRIPSVGVFHGCRGVGGQCPVSGELRDTHPKCMAHLPAIRGRVGRRGVGDVGSGPMLPPRSLRYREASSRSRTSIAIQIAMTGGV